MNTQIFTIAELYGLWTFWFCAEKFKSDIEQSGDIDLKKIGKTLKVYALDNTQNFKGGPGESQNIANPLIHSCFPVAGVSRNTVKQVVLSISISRKGHRSKW